MILERFLAVKREDVLAPDRVALFRGIWAKALLKPEPFRRAIAEFMPVQTFAELVTPCTITAVDVVTGKEVAFGTGGIDAPLVDAVSRLLAAYVNQIRFSQRSAGGASVRSRCTTVSKASPTSRCARAATT